MEQEQQRFGFATAIKASTLDRKVCGSK